MAVSSAEQMRSWKGPAILSYGFRPFFLCGAAWAALAMLLWVLVLGGAIMLPTAFDPISWHAHAFLFGYLSAVIAGFLLTAVPNWTGRLPIVGWPLAGLAALWLLGRIAVLGSAYLSPIVAAAVDLAFPCLLAAVLLREIIAGRNWRNLIIFVLLSLFTIANLIFHIEAAHGTFAARGVGMRFGLATAVMMIAVVGGRIIPSFTRNWMAKTNNAALPAPPMQAFDKVSLLASVVVLVMWVAFPYHWAAGVGMAVFAMLHLVRLARWKGHHTIKEPLLFVLHVAYACVPLGALINAVAILDPSTISTGAAQHVWMAGALGLMTIAVMSRATLGHTGRTLEANRATIMIYVGLCCAVICRLLAEFLPQALFYHLSAGFWIFAFGGFTLAYGPLLAFAKKTATT